jgi:hypothetical protein
MKGWAMNLQDELELLIRAHYPILTIISNKVTWVPSAAIKAASKRRKKPSSRH